MAERYAIGSRIYSGRVCIGEIMAYGSDNDETYLVDSWGMLTITNRAILNKKATIEPPAADSYWGWTAKKQDKPSG